MHLGSFIVTFTVIWWVLLFIILPIGIKQEDNPEVGHSYGAPKNPQILKKLTINTIISLILSIIFEYSMYNFNLGKFLEKFLEL